MRGVSLADGEQHARRPRRAGARPQRARHLRDAARARRVPRSQALLDRLPHRASAIADRRARASARRPGIRCSARPTTSWCTTAATAARSTASACARAAPWSRPRREPGRVVTNGMSQYSRNERNANAGIVVGITPEDYAAVRPDGGPLAGIALAAPLGRARVRARRRRLRGAGATGRRFPGATGRRREFGAVLPSYKPGVRLGDLDALPAGLRDRRDPRGAAGVRQADQGLRDARRGADRRGDAHVLAGAHHPRRRRPEPEYARPVSRPAKARAMPAASCRPAWTASRSPKRSRWRSPAPLALSSVEGALTRARNAAPPHCAARPVQPRNARLRILPVAVIGSASTTSTMRGYL